MNKKSKNHHHCTGCVSGRMRFFLVFNNAYFCNLKTVLVCQFFCIFAALFCHTVQAGKISSVNDFGDCNEIPRATFWHGFFLINRKL